MKRLQPLGVAAAVLLSSFGNGEAAVRSAIRILEVEICWESASNVFYQVQHSARLTSDVWNNLGPPMLADGPTSCLRDKVSGSCRFYRVAAADAVRIRVSELEICWRSASNLLYQAQERSSNAWTDLGPVVQAVGPTTCRSYAVSGPDRVYRVLGPDVAWIPPGTLVMGSPPDEPARWSDEGPQTTVTITRGFSMGRYEVTQTEYLEVMGENPSYFQGANYLQEPNLPVELVTWFDATNYCGRLTEQERAAGRLPAGYVYRLPTEAEWEYACRAGTTTAFHYGPALRAGMANFDGRYEYPPCGNAYYYCHNPAGTYLLRTTAAGSSAPNAWGLHDMHGNVGEWCANWYGVYSGGSVPDPKGPASGLNRVIRGGGWNDIANLCRSASRSWDVPDHGYYSRGFRVVLAPGPP